MSKCVTVLATTVTAAHKVAAGYRTDPMQTSQQLLQYPVPHDLFE